MNLILPRKKTTLLLVVAAIILITGISRIVIGQNMSKGIVRVESEPSAVVTVDGIRVGTTPVEYETENKNIILKLTPESPYLPYETSLSLTPYTKTIVRHKFNSDVSLESSQILAFRKDAVNGGSMTILTNPSNSKVFFDNTYVGTSPLKVSKPIGTYSIQVIHNGFTAVSFVVKNTPSYELTADISLPRHSTALAKVLQEAESQLIATILNTPTGFLYVHEKPLESSHTIARINPGREYPVRSMKDKQWIEIGLNASESGWITARYATVSGQTATPP